MEVPYYYKSIDFDALIREYPPAKEFAEGVFLWDRKRLEELQDRRFLELVERGWSAPASPSCPCTIRREWPRTARCSTSSPRGD